MLLTTAETLWTIALFVTTLLGRKYNTLHQLDIMQKHDPHLRTVKIYSLNSKSSLPLFSL